MVKNPNPLNWFVSNTSSPAETTGEFKTSYAKLNGASERLSPPQQLSLKRLNIVSRATEGLGTVTFNTTTSQVNDGRVADVVNKIATVARNSGTHEQLQGFDSQNLETPQSAKVLATMPDAATQEATTNSPEKGEISEASAFARLAKIHGVSVDELRRAKDGDLANNA